MSSINLRLLFNLVKKHFLQWHYLFLCRNRAIDIFGKNTQTEFYFDWSRKLEAADRQQIIRTIKDDFKDYGSEFTEVPNSLATSTFYSSPRINKSQN